MSSPWWYRRRPLVIFAIYAIGFFGGWWLWARVTGLPDKPVYGWVALRLHVSAELMIWVATIVTIAAFLIRLWGSSYLTAQVVWNADARDDRLIVDGPFRFIRNPLYLGSNLLALGVGSLATPYGFVFIVLGNVFFTALLAAHETAIMRARYGSVYERFRVAVPSMLPRLTPARVEGSVRGAPTLANGIRSELLTAGFAAGMIALALFGLRAVPFFEACWIGGWLLQSILRARG